MTLVITRLSTMKWIMTIVACCIVLVSSDPHSSLEVAKQPTLSSSLFLFTGYEFNSNCFSFADSIHFTITYLTPQLFSTLTHKSSAYGTQLPTKILPHKQTCEVVHPLITT